MLDEMWGELRQLGYMPAIFDFDKPSRRDRVETVTLLAYLSRFLIVDITDARSVPAELQSILPNLSVPVRPILDRRDTHGSFSLFEEFAKFEWLLLPVFLYDNPAHLMASLKTEIVEPAEEWLRVWNPAARSRRNANSTETRRQVNDGPRTPGADTLVGPASDKPIATGDVAEPAAHHKYPVGI